MVHFKAGIWKVNVFEHYRKVLCVALVFAIQKMHVCGSNRNVKCLVLT